MTAIFSKNNSELRNAKVVRIIAKCPSCKANDFIEVPDDIVNEAIGLTGITVAPGIVCEHRFLIYLDKNFAIRGSQPICYEVSSRY